MSQKEKVLKYIKDNGSITSMDAFREFKITRLAAIIFDLKKDGVDIKTEPRQFKKDGRTSYFAEYSILGATD